jgi:catechol 2,3-dioxygenase-like lactoylglutathione lyase family enzyme
MEALAFSFMKLVVTDLERAERFYCDVFGMTVAHRHKSGEHAFAQEESVLSLPDDKSKIPLILTHYLTQPTPAGGSAWTGFTVSDVEATAVAIEGAGGKIEVPVHQSVSHPVKAAIARDPDGHMIELIQILPG